MIRQIIGFLFRLALGFLTFVVGVCTIIYVMIWDFIRGRILRKKPIQNPCFEKVLEKDEIFEIDTIEILEVKKKEAINN